jgi:hypothetical protein
MSFALDGQEVNPMHARFRRDGWRANASAMAAKALNEGWGWEIVLSATYDISGIDDAEARKLRRLCHAALNCPGDMQPALLDYVRYLHTGLGLPECAVIFGEGARVLAGDKVSGDLLAELGTLYRKMCRWKEADTAWTQLENLGSEEWRLRAQLGKGMIARHRGNLRRAEELFLTVAAGSHHLPAVRAMGLNNLGTVYDHMHPPRYEDAALAYWDAHYLHPDPVLRSSSLMNVGTAARGCRHWKLADLCFRLVIHANRCWEDVTNCYIERLDVLSALHDLAGVRDVRNMLRFRVEQLTPDFRIDYHYRLGLIELRTGKNPAPEWQQAYWLATQHRLGEWVVRLEKELETPLPELRKIQHMEPEEPPRLHAMWKIAEKDAEAVGA